MGSGAWLVWEWYDNVAAGLSADRRLLMAGLGLLGLSLFGRWLITPLLGRRARPGEEMGALPAGEVARLAQPDGAVLHTELYGPAGAPTLLFTHGWGLSRAEWYYAHRHLAGRYRLLLWDLPGLGQSTAPRDGQYDLERLAGHLDAVLTQAGDGPVILVGHSIGGMIMLTWCRRLPEAAQRRVVGLILTHTTATNPVLTSWGGRVMRRLQEPVLRPLCALTIALSPLVRLMNGLTYLGGLSHLGIHLLQFAGAETRGQLEFAAQHGLRANPGVAARGMLAMMRYEAVDALPTIALPTLVVAASRDRATLPAASEFITRGIPHAQQVVLATAGHLGLLEQHRDWLTAVEGFTARCLTGNMERRKPRTS